jgi:hypothetical protein
MKRSLVLLFVGAPLFASTHASAQQGPAEQQQQQQPAAPPPERTWYGWQTLSTDAAAVAALAAGLSIRNDSFHLCDTCDAERYVNPHSILEATGVLSYLGGGLLVHLAHHQRKKGFYSLALRAAAPAAGALVGGVTGWSVACTGGSHWCFGSQLGDWLEGTAFGAALGFFAAVVLDASAFAYEDHPAVPKPASAAGGWQVVPVAALPRDMTGRSTPSFGLAGVF